MKASARSSDADLLTTVMSVLHFCTFVLTFEMTDDYKHKGMRRKLVEVLATKGITDQAVLSAMDTVPRHLFFDNAFLSHAYEDKAFPIGSGQTISQPYTVAFQSQLLEVEKGMKVLEIGTGSGYQTAILCELGAKVFSIERHRPLYKNAQAILQQLGYKAKLFYGDGYKGLPTFAPFDRVIVTCGATFIPEELGKQLKEEGRIVIPVGGRDDQEMKLGVKQAGGLEVTNHGVFRFVPMLEHKNSGEA